MYVRLHSESSESTICSSRTMPDEDPPMPRPSRWPALIALPTLVNFQLVWRRLDDVVPCTSCLVKYGLTDAPLLIKYRFQAARVAPNTLQLRSRGRPSLCSALPRVRSPSLLHSSALSRVLLPFLPNFLRPASLSPSFSSPLSVRDMVVVSTGCCSVI